MGEESRDKRPRPGSLRHAPNIDTTPYRDGLMGSASCVHIENMGTPPSLLIPGQCFMSAARFPRVPLEYRASCVREFGPGSSGCLPGKVYSWAACPLRREPRVCPHIGAVLRGRSVTRGGIPRSVFTPLQA